jgi:endoglycosylceramidase
VLQSGHSICISAPNPRGIRNALQFNEEPSMHRRAQRRWWKWFAMRAATCALSVTLTTCDYLYYDLERLSDSHIAPVPLTDAHGRICIYHGVNVSNYAKSSSDFTSWHTQEDFARLREWGFNIVRYLVFWEALEPAQGVVDTAYLNNVLLRVQWLAQLDIDVILDMHQDLYSSAFGGDGFPRWTIRADTTHYQMVQPWQDNYLSSEVMESFRAFWTNDTLRAAYLNILNVLFAAAEPLPNVIGIDVMNEPFESDIDAFESTTLSGFYAHILDMVAHNGFTKKVIFEPSIIRSVGLPSELAFETRDRCIYAPHFYDVLAGQTAYYGSTARLIMQEAMFTRVQESVALDCPLLFGEYGISPSVTNYVQYLRDFNDEADGYLAGRIYWSYDRISNSEYGIIDDAGGVRPCMEALVRIHPQRIMGRDPVIARSQKQFSLTYTKVDGAAPTVLFIPPTFANVTITANGIPRAHAGFTFAYYNDSATEQHLMVTWE